MESQQRITYPTNRRSSRTESNSSIVPRSFCFSRARKRDSSLLRRSRSPRRCVRSLRERSPTWEESVPWRPGLDRSVWRSAGIEWKRRDRSTPQPEGNSRDPWWNKSLTDSSYRWRETWSSTSDYCTMEGLCQQTRRIRMPDQWWPRRENTPHRIDAEAMNDWRRERWGNCRSFRPRRYSNRYICRRWYPWDVDKDRATSSDPASRCPNWNWWLTRTRMKTNSTGWATDSRGEARESSARRSSRRTSRDSISSSNLKRERRTEMNSFDSDSARNSTTHSSWQRQQNTLVDGTEFYLFGKDKE